MKNIKKWISLSMVLVMLLVSAPVIGLTDGMGTVTASAISSSECGKELTWTLDDATGTLTVSGTGSMYYYSILQGAVYQITPPWYENRGAVKKIVIGEGVTEIGNYAFYGCSKATSVEIAGSVRKIGEKAFAGCAALSGLSMKNGLEEIGEYAFENCDALMSVSLPGTVTTIGDGAFYSCGALEAVTLPDSLVSLGKKVFYSCGALKAVTVPGGVKTIGEKTFYQCYKLASVTLAEGVEEIGEQAFYKNGALTQVSLPETLTRIGEKSFYSCGDLEMISIPGHVKTIGDSAFASCERLETVLLGDGVETIGKQTFSGCALESLTLPRSLRTLGDAAFMNCGQLGEIDNRAKLTKCGVLVFYGTKWLNEYPEPVIYLGDVLYGVRSDYDQNSLAVQDGTRLIADSACNNLPGLVQITLPQSVEYIGSYAFYNCSSLATVVLPRSVTSVSQKAFAGCDAMTDITIYNAECDIYDAADTLPTDAVITSLEGSTAQDYAVRYSRAFRTHVHEYTEIVSVPATCTEDGESVGRCICGEEMTTVTQATGHADENGDGVCDACDTVLCTCICHRSGFVSVFYRILRFFWKLFGTNPVCDCGAAHY